MGGTKFIQGLWVWSLVTLDQVPPAEIQGQFVAESHSEDLSTNWSSDIAPGSEDEILQWAGGAKHTHRFRARLWKDHIFDDLTTKIAQIKSLVEKDYFLGRPPVAMFTIGHDIVETVVVESVGGINYDKPDYTGAILGVSFELTLRKYKEFTLAATNPYSSIPESRLYWAKTGDTFESIALKEYGSPNFGPYLRFRSDGLYETEFGTRVHVIPKRKVIRQPLVRYSIPFSQGERTRGRQQEILDRHSGPYVAHGLNGDL